MFAHNEPQQNPAHLLENETIQSKLKIGQPGDKYEREADRVADAVMRMPDSQVQMQPLAGNGQLQMKPQVPGIQRMCPRCQKRAKQGKPLNCPECEEKLQMTPAIQKQSDGQVYASTDITSQLSSSKGQGRKLPTPVQQEMGHKMGADFSGVHIHTDGKSQQLNQQLGARAFTYGSDIYFNKTEYNPGSNSGKRLLAHELTHVVQQGSGQTIIQKQQSTLTAESTFINWWDEFPRGTADEVKRHIGGKVNYDWIKNTCAIRMSRVLNYSGYEIPYKKGQTISGDDNKWYFFRIRNLRPFIESKMGAPDYSFSPPYDMNQLSNIKGIILFDVDVWEDATGHFTLWNGGACADKCYFNKASEIHIWLP